MENDDTGCTSDYQYGRRGQRVYPLTERELSLLVWAPIWSRSAMVRLIKRETDFTPLSPAE